MASIPANPRRGEGWVFISYRDRPASAGAALRLAEYLRSAGFRVLFDKWAGDENHSWYQWMTARVTAADYILFVPTAGYFNQAEKGISTGVGWETRCMYHRLSVEHETFLERLRPVIFADLPNSGEDECHIKHRPMGWPDSYFRIDSSDMHGQQDGIVKLQRWLQNSGPSASTAAPAAAPAAASVVASATQSLTTAVGAVMRQLRAAPPTTTPDKQADALKVFNDLLLKQTPKERGVARDTAVADAGINTVLNVLRDYREHWNVVAGAILALEYLVRDAPPPAAVNECLDTLLDAYERWVGSNEHRGDMMPRIATAIEALVPSPGTSSIDDARRERVRRVARSLHDHGFRIHPQPRLQQLWG